MLALVIKHKALKLGYLACGIIPADEVHEYTRHLDKCVKSFPESKKLYEPLYDLARLPEAAKSIIVCTQRYNGYKVPDTLSGLIGKLYMFDGRIPYSKEYRAETEFEMYLKILGVNILQCDVPVRLAAAKAGLGKFGRNNFIYDAEHGSYIWIDAWVTDKELDYDAVQETALLSECNEDCKKCIQSCPTKALAGSLSMDRGKCVAHLQFYTGTLEENIRSQMGLWQYGCDACQDVCPLNKDKFMEPEEFPLLEEFEEYLKPEHILEMDEDTYINIINPRFWYAGKGGLWLWKCNTLRVMINSGEKKYHSLIKKYCNHADNRISETAQWGCDKLGI